MSSSKNPSKNCRHFLIWLGVDPRWIAITAKETLCAVWKVKSTAFDRVPSPNVSKWNRSSNSPCWPNGRRNPNRNRRRWVNTDGRRQTLANDRAWKKSIRHLKRWDGPFRQRPNRPFHLIRITRPRHRHLHLRAAAAVIAHHAAEAVRPAVVKNGQKSRRSVWPWTTSKRWQESSNTTLCSSWTTTMDSVPAVYSSPTEARWAVWAASEVTAATEAICCRTIWTRSTISQTSQRPSSTTSIIAAQTTTWPLIFSWNQITVATVFIADSIITRSWWEPTHLSQTHLDPPSNHLPSSSSLQSGLSKSFFAVLLNECLFRLVPVQSTILSWPTKSIIIIIITNTNRLVKKKKKKNQKNKIATTSVRVPSLK